MADRLPRQAAKPQSQPGPRRGGLTRRGFLGSTAALSAASWAHAYHQDEPYLYVYTNRLSYAPGETIWLHTSTNARDYDVEIERVGKSRHTVWSRRNLDGDEHRISHDASMHGCRWPVSLEIPIRDDWPSGVYRVKTSPSSYDIDYDGDRRRLYTYFVVRAAPDRPSGTILMQLTTNTDNAYNNWGGYSLYAFNSRFQKQSHRVSFLRPQQGFTFRQWELPFIEWAEAAGYKLDFAVNNDLEFHPEILEPYKLVLSVGHDEYWSKPMRDALEGFTARGGNAAFFSGNVAAWQVRVEHASLVCYKQHYRDDPRYEPDGPNPELTTLWSHYLVDRPENELTNVGVLSGGFHRSHNQYQFGSGAYTVYRPEHWVFSGTDVEWGEKIGGDKKVVGYECDGCEVEFRDGLPYPTGADRTPKDFEILAMGRAKWGQEPTLIWYERWPDDQKGSACLGLSTRDGGGTVFTVGSTDWSHGLAGKPDPVIERITRNVLDRLS